MRAIACRDWGAPSVLEIVDLPKPVPGPAEVLVDVRAAGIGFHDALMVAGKYQLKPDFPVVPGSDVAGVVEACGEEVTSLQVGDRVFAVIGHGGCAERVAVPEGAAVKLPADIPFTQGAAIGMPYGTAYQGLVDRAGLGAGETLLVRGAAGGVGRAAVELGKHLGARVIAAASTPEKREIALQAGADQAIEAGDEIRDRVRELTEGRGADVIFDTVGDPGFRPACLSSVARGGRILIVGFAGGEIPQIPAHYFINKFCSITGVSFSGRSLATEPERFRAILAALVALCAKGAITPLVDLVVPPEGAVDAFTRITERKVRGRAVVAFGD